MKNQTADKPTKKWQIGYDLGYEDGYNYGRADGRADEAYARGVNRGRAIEIERLGAPQK